MNDREPLIEALPENLTHCSECGLAFPEAVTNWDDFFSEVEDAAFHCTACADEFDGTATNVR